MLHTCHSHLCRVPYAIEQITLNTTLYIDRTYQCRDTGAVRGNGMLKEQVRNG
jgi:hypothetical protein